MSNVGGQKKTSKWETTQSRVQKLNSVAQNKCCLSSQSTDYEGSVSEIAANTGLQLSNLTFLTG